MLIPSHAQAVPASTAAPDPGWLTQPVATVIAAGVALLVACVTLVGIWLNHRQHREKERIAAIERRRTEAVEALVEALESATTAFGLVAEAVDEISGLPVVRAESETEVESALDRCRVMHAKVHLLGLDEDDAMGALTRALGGVWQDILIDGRQPPDFDKAWRAREQLLKSFRATVDRHRNLYDPPTMLTT
ncbi:hypothetical protein GS504_20770 [Rhodococcus hoagii]|nr:hypothetical protein [Prescottella equi]NKS59885.1 hypothetical protein [Prescottella equi]NKS70674.1 hypothetical protein [Prescottella equi]